MKNRYFFEHVLIAILNTLPVMVKRCGGYIYVMSKDAKSGNVINVFDNKGVFLCAIGERGHAKNEYIDSPTCFSFDYTNGDIHVYERASNRILVFDKLGEFKREVKFDGGFPNSACATESGNYLCSFNERQNDSYDRLALYDKNGKRIKVFYQLGKMKVCLLLIRWFFLINLYVVIIIHFMIYVQ